MLGGGTLFERLARLARNMVLARLIAPDQFGMMAIVLAVVALFEALLEVGIGQAVIQNERGNTPEFLNVAWWLSGIRGVLLFVVAAALSPVVARIYDNPDLTPLLLVAFSTMVFSGFTSPRVWALQRQFRFGVNVVVVQGAGLLGTVFTIILGLQLHNVWALVLGTVFESFARCVLSYILCPIRPRLPLDRRALRELLQFTLGMAGLPLLTYLVMNADVVVLGWVASASELGLYSLAVSLAAFPLMVFSKVVQPLAVPLFVSFQHDNEGLCSVFLRVTRLVWLFGLPMATCMAVFSEPLLVLVYGRPEFALVAPAFSIYAVFVVTYMAGMVSFSVYLAIAQPGLQRRFTVVRAVLIVISLYPLSLLLGGTGASLALLVSIVVAMGVQLFNMRRVIGLPILGYLATIRAGVLAAGIVAVPSLAVRLLLDVPGWMKVVAGALIGAMVWGWAIRREGRELWRMRKAQTLHPPELKSPTDLGAAS
jgi:lipopolysaccharide exporter